MCIPSFVHLFFIILIYTAYHSYWNHVPIDIPLICLLFNHSLSYFPFSALCQFCLLVPTTHLYTFQTNSYLSLLFARVPSWDPFHALLFGKALHIIDLIGLYQFN